LRTVRPSINRQEYPGLEAGRFGELLPERTERRELLLDDPLVEVLFHLPLKVSLGVDLIIDPLHEVAFAGHHHHLCSAFAFRDKVS
jgi:hypothetical protein